LKLAEYVLIHSQKEKPSKTSVDDNLESDHF
ncbi:MAG: cytochrome C, partial [Sulfurihydrogenibium sp.]